MLAVRALLAEARSASKIRIDSISPSRCRTRRERRWTSFSKILSAVPATAGVIFLLDVSQRLASICASPAGRADPNSPLPQKRIRRCRERFSRGTHHGWRRFVVVFNLRDSSRSPRSLLLWRLPGRCPLSSLETPGIAVLRAAGRTSEHAPNAYAFSPQRFTNPRWAGRGNRSRRGRAPPE